MTTIGDVFAVIFTLIGVGLTAWALTLSCGLLFPERVEIARTSVDRGFWRNLPLGLLMLLIGAIGVALIAAPVGKLLGWAIVLGVLGIGAVGMAGISHFVAARLKQMAPDLGDYPATVRAAAFLVTASMLPVLGWFLFAPALLLTAFSAGARAAFHRASSPAVQPRTI